MVGRTQTSDVRSRLGKRGASGAQAKSGKIRDARDVLRKKVVAKGRPTQPKGRPTQPKGRPTQVGNANTRARIRRLMPLADLITEKKTISYDRTSSSSKDKVRTLSLTSGSLRVTTKQPELCRRTIVSSNSLKVVTPSKSIGKKETSTSDSTTRTLTNDLYTKEKRLPLVTAMDEDLRTSSPSLSFTRPAQERPIFRPSLGRERQDPIPVQHDHKILTKIVVTNLHPRVVQEDIAELFGAVGPLLSVKLDNCVAEVLFVKADQADTAYQKYHNRMLDGQAMKCTLGLANTVANTPVASTPMASTQVASTQVASTQVETSQEHERLNYSGAELVYPKTPSRPVVFQVRI